MKSTILSALLATCLSAFGHPIVIYVTEAGTGDGSSWATATGDLHAALAAAKPGTEIWVAEGTYRPANCLPCTPADRQRSFQIPSEVKLYGGFAGDESSLSQRKWFAHPTKLSGEIGTEDDTDNSYTVVTVRHAAEGTLLDGFVVTAGHADGWAQPGSLLRSGGGLFNDGAGTGNHSRLVVRNCVFLDNYADEGAAIFNHGAKGHAELRLENCTFVDNRAAKGGGGLFSNNDGGKGYIDLKKCKFVKNSAAFGAAVFVTQLNGTGKNQIVQTNFVANKATAGSAFFSLAVPDKLTPDFFLCDYINNLDIEEEEIFYCPDPTVPARLMKALTMSVSQRL